jgi:hypothetical protein
VAGNKTTRVLDSDRSGALRRGRGSSLLVLFLGCMAGCACSRVEPGSEEAVGPGAEVSDVTEASPAMSPGVPAALLEAALADAANRTTMTRTEITVVSAAAVTWSDGSAGCPEPGMMYTQALVPGYRIVLQAGDQVLNYHAGRSGPAKYCPAERVIAPSSAGEQAT